MKKYDAYKDSGVKWIGEIPEHWEIAPLKSCFNVLSGATPKSTELSYWEDGNINWITPADFKTEDRLISDGAKKITKEGFMSCSTTLIPSGSIIFSKRAPIGSVVINSNEVCTNQGCFSCIPKDDISSLFFYYIMSVSQKYFDMLGTGTTFNEISANVFKNVHLPVPPLPEQQAIASYLDAKTEKIDQMIAKAEKKIEYLGELKQSLITRAVTRGLNPNTPLKDSGVKWIGSVPYHWEIISLKRLLTNERDNLKVGPFGSQLQGKDIVDESEYWIYNQRSVLDNNFETTNSYITEEKFLDMSSFAVRKDDILITTRGTIGKIARVPQQYHKGIIHPCIIKFRIDKGKVHYPFIERLFNDSNIIKTEVKLSSNATTIEVIYGGTLKELHLPFPPLTEQQQIANYLDTKCSKIDHIIATQKKKIAYLQELKQSLITNVVTGKIKVS